jgi:Golgi nucleoside diphosphatase
LYGFSEYWFSMDDVLSLGGLYDHDKFEAKARGFCQQHWRAIKVIEMGMGHCKPLLKHLMVQDKFRAKFFRKADLDRLETQCFKSAWIHAIL